MVDESDAIMIDIGTYNIKAGFAGEDAPKVTIPTIIGRAKAPGFLIGLDQKDFYIGYEAKSKRHLLNIVEPVKDGHIEDYEEIGNILTEMMH
jgi:actin